MAEVAEMVGGKLRGDGSLAVTAVRPTAEAGPGELAFLASGRYARELSKCAAPAYLVSKELASRIPAEAGAVVVETPHAALRVVLDRLHPAREARPGIHPTAVVGRSVELGEDVVVGPYAVIEDGATIGDRARIGAHCVVGEGAGVGGRSVLHPHVVLYHGCRIGERCIVHSGVRIGSDGFGFVFRDGSHRKIPQVGAAIIGDDVEIGANSTVDRGSIGDTVVGSGSKLDNLVHIAHNVRVGARSLFAALVGVAGSTRVGRDVWMGGKVGVSDHLTIGDGARLAIASKVMKNVAAGTTVSGHPAGPHRRQMRQQAGARRVGKLERRVRKIERVLALRGGSKPPARAPEETPDARSDHSDREESHLD
ncbi:MAG: UDP-3-O-(3-hydroxymyristoyl)glucosamine N-acyltransferase [Gemmatimonadetes bacterium]|nr:UDP-3-O-(3-hydroxymyristoyl)glucosamine N-acyltransferase [Gemmatimonadota bacterium]